jgi:hypothetical protein
MARTLDEDYGKHVKIYTDGSKVEDKVGYVVVKEEHTIKKRILQLLKQSNRQKITNTKK